MRPSRYLASRLVFGGLTVVLFFVLIYAGLGWTVWRREP